MKNFRITLALSAFLMAACLHTTTGIASAAPAWDVKADVPTRVAPGKTFNMIVAVANSGDTDSDGTGALDIALPAGITGTAVTGLFGFGPFAWSCSDPVGASDIHCDLSAPVEPGAGAERFIVSATADQSASGPRNISLQMSGGGASGSVGIEKSIDISATPDFGITEFDGASNSNPDGDSYTQAGGHAYSASITFELNTITGSVGEITSDGGSLRNLHVDLPPGFIGNPTAVPQCPTDVFLGSISTFDCPGSTQVGLVEVSASFGKTRIRLSQGPSTPKERGTLLFNLPPPLGVAASFGFIAAGVPVIIDARLRQGEEGYAVRAEVREASQSLGVLGAKVTLWGTPADPAHDSFRNCAGTSPLSFGCSSQSLPTAFIASPTSCTPVGSGLRTEISVDSWQDPGVFTGDSFISHEPPGFSFDEAHPEDEWGPPVGTTGCENVPFNPSIESSPTTDQAETPSGLRFGLAIPDDGILNPEGISQAQIKKSVVSLPEGVTLNPSQAEGLGVCTPAQYESTELSAFPTPGKGCPDVAKIGTVDVRTPVLDETLEGNVYVAQPDDPGTTAQGAENPFDSLIALYIVVENVERGLLVKLPGKVEPDPKTGRILVTFDDLPQVPFSSFEFRFREGGRAPLVTPPSCGTYTTEAEFVPWSAADPDNPQPDEIEHVRSQFQITKGVGGGACPKGGIPPFEPGFSAGSINNNAGSHTAFNMRLTRRDGEQNMTRFSAVLPPGVLGKLAGVSKCPDSAIALAKSKTGRQELASPSCPVNSQIGRSLVGAGVGSVLTYVPGKIYLGGPLHGDPLSVIAITPAVAGPFDVGTVVVREALTLDPKTAEVEVDGAASDPIPHILKGIPAKLRELRVYVDRDNFIVNPTGCDPSQVKATLSGSYLDVLNPADDLPVSLSDRFQAANCAALGFKPKLGLTLKGGTKRGGHPGLKALYMPRKGDANVEGLVVRLPRSAFLDQAHIRTICTRVQFAADACPPAAQYGFIKAWTPLLEEPLAGPVWLRSSNHKLPDLVFDLHGLVDVEVATRIDSAKGGIRATVEDAPDAPLSKVELKMRGGKKGLIVNSRNLCSALSRANVEFAGHNGKEAKANPVMRADCGGKRKGKRTRR